MNYNNKIDGSEHASEKNSNNKNTICDSFPLKLVRMCSAGDTSHKCLGTISACKSQPKRIFFLMPFFLRIATQPVTRKTLRLFIILTMRSQSISNFHFFVVVVLICVSNGSACRMHSNNECRCAQSMWICDLRCFNFIFIHQQYDARSLKYDCMWFAFASMVCVSVTAPNRSLSSHILINAIIRHCSLKWHELKRIEDDCSINHCQLVWRKTNAIRYWVTNPAKFQARYCCEQHCERALDSVRLRFIFASRFTHPHNCCPLPQKSVHRCVLFWPQTTCSRPTIT